MSNIKKASEILLSIGFGEKQSNTMCALTLLALSAVSSDNNFSEACNNWIRIHDILIFCDEAYHINYAENSRETFRKQALHHFRLAGIVEDNGKATNSPDYRYRLTQEMLHLVQQYETECWEFELRDFLSKHDDIRNKYEHKRQKADLHANINETIYSFSPGKHNELQCAVLEEFVKYFVPDCLYLYCGDTRDKDLFCDVERLKALGITITTHDKMPDVILYSTSRNWLYFIECVTSVGPFSPKRVEEIQNFANRQVLEKFS